MFNPRANAGPYTPPRQTAIRSSARAAPGQTLSLSPLERVEWDAVERGERFGPVIEPRLLRRGIEAWKAIGAGAARPIAAGRVPIITPSTVCPVPGPWNFGEIVPVSRASPIDACLVLAYSVQLAVLVATAALIVSVLRIDTPRANLRFWQVLLAASLFWPGYQLWMDLDVSREGFAGGRWSVASASVAEIRTGVVAMNADVATTVVFVLATGAAIRLAWLGLGLIRLRSIRADSEPAHSLSSIAGPMLRELRVTADICFSDAVTSPATIGMRRPIVLLPRHVQDLPPAVQRAVLSHELFHVRRRAWLPALLEEVWCAVLWFHPAARVLASRLSLARETLVDEASIAHTGDRRAYAAALLEFSTARPRLPGATALIGRRHLEQRIALIAQEVSMSRSSLALRMAAAAGAVVLATLATTSNVPMAAALQSQAERVYRPGQDTGLTLPRAVTEVKPVYTPAAMQARIQGTVWMTAVVLANGDVGDVTVVKSLDTEHGLDQQAVDATRQWKFEPGTREGKAVPVEVTIEMTFTLK